MPVDRALGRAMLEESLAICRDLGDAAGEGNALWGLGGFERYVEDPSLAVPWYRQALDLHRATGHRTMEAWTLHMLSVTLIALSQVDEGEAASNQALAFFREAGDVSGVTLAFDALASVAVARRDLRRGGRLWGAARQLQHVSGTGLAAWDEAIFARLPSSPRGQIPPADLDRLAVEGAALPLAEAIAYALAEVDPFGEADSLGEG